MPTDSNDDRSAFESAVQALEAEVANAGTHITIDAKARWTYALQIRVMADDLRGQVSRGKITWAQAASQAQEARNAVMGVIRGRSTPIGLAIAQKLKSEGRTLNELIARKTVQLFGPASNFNHLTPAGQNAVYAEIVKAAAKSDPKVTATMRRLSRAGRGLLFLSIALSAYAVVTADDERRVATREFTVTGAGIGGGMVGGALAGLACGPGAPVCVTVGAFVRGALAAFGVDLLW